jgi:hypothetical protein
MMEPYKSKLDNSEIGKRLMEQINAGGIDLGRQIAKNLVPDMPSIPFVENPIPKHVENIDRNTDAMRRSVLNLEETVVALRLDIDEANKSIAASERKTRRYAFICACVSDVVGVLLTIGATILGIL